MSSSIRKVLIANRGEIAVRIARACHELGKEVVAVYSDADSAALHVQVADAAVRIGPSPAAASYLNIEAILEAAHRSGADAVHPGYGFLSENPEFAEACAAAGLTFIGPSPEAMRAMGDKSAAKRLAEQAGVPVVPGYHGEDSRRERLVQEAARIGYPLLVKAAAGGGGRGMRVVAEPGALEEALAGAEREAAAAFGDSRLLLERYLTHARHIEVQLLGDRTGRILVLGERECSLQRRHQKVVEEAPAPGLDEAIRRDMFTAAARLAQAIGYRNAGTVEFILAADAFYFLEMNTRLQVEHGVTELITGLDIVHLQLAIAEGRTIEECKAQSAKFNVPPASPTLHFEPGTLNVELVEPHGHAMECRVYAEDPSNGFLPSPGKLLLFEAPQGPGVRNDLGVYQGAEVSPYYDPQLAKLLVYAQDRAAALRRLERALREYVVAGVATNLPLLRAIAACAEFQRGAVSTRFLEASLLPRFMGTRSDAVPDEVVAAAAGFELLSVADGVARAPANPWLAAGRLRGGERAFRYRSGEREYQVSAGRVLAPNGEQAWRVRSGSTEAVVRWQLARPDVLVAMADGAVQVFHCARQRESVTVVWRGESYRLAKPGPARLDPAVAGGGPADQRGLAAPMPSVVARVLVAAGDAVGARQTLVVLTAMKMEHLIQAPAAGTVRRVCFREGESVPEGAVLIELE